jgi:hypothetical protein
MFTEIFYSPNLPQLPLQPHESGIHSNNNTPKFTTNSRSSRFEILKPRVHGAQSRAILPPDLADGSSVFLGDPPPDPRFFASLGVLSWVELHHCRNVDLLASGWSEPHMLVGHRPSRGIHPQTTPVFCVNMTNH